MAGYTYHVLHLCAPNDRNGNPRRAYVVLFDDGVHAFFDEGYQGRSALPRDYADNVTWELRVSPGELRRWRSAAQWGHDSAGKAFHNERVSTVSGGAA